MNIVNYDKRLVCIVSTICSFIETIEFINIVGVEGALDGSKTIRHWQRFHKRSN